MTGDADRERSLDRSAKEGGVKLRWNELDPSIDLLSTTAWTAVLFNDVGLLILRSRGFGCDRVETVNVGLFVELADEEVGIARRGDVPVWFL